MKQWINYGSSACIHGLTTCEIAFVTSFRMAAMAGKAGQDPAQYVAKRLGSETLSKQLSLIVAAISDAWPDRFTLSRPCCQRMTFDEVTVIGMLRSSGANDRRAFDEILQDMLSEETRDFLYTLFVRFSVQTRIASH